MNRFGSFKLRIVWASVFIFLFLALLIGLKTTSGADGFAIHAFGATIPQDVLASIAEFVDPMQYARSVSRAIIGWAVPFTFLATAYFSIVEAIESHKLKGFLQGTILGAASGFFYSQLAILPIWAFCAKIMGALVPMPLALANLHALILGLQLLIWAIIFNRLIRSNRGIALVLAMGLSAVGTKICYLADFGQNFGLTEGQVAAAKFANYLLPSVRVAEDPIAWGTLGYGIAGALVLAALLMLLPESKVGKGK